ncbi:pro-sigmaK processing inhibitor BofA family protein [Gracilibacillus sp. YIM 98692]|uniref:pro-sigmaK processing inhibitor BofA family protein n=1 Tax=Gracilibacillus sp. YIM 98692 TaxID=2663532 RepID=UPI0013D3304C|nr:pro-sigmaK processing inhibitor BofA family protein [Gracilibacillus sp. YIM 98692]
MNGWVIFALVTLIAVLLIKGVPVKLVRSAGQGMIKITIGVLFLFFFNLFGASFGLHLPINVFTAIIVGLLGIPGIASLTAIHLFVL